MYAYEMTKPHDKKNVFSKTPLKLGAAHDQLLLH
jgi:hypothetical protein